MRTIEVFRFDELSEEAKQNAVENVINLGRICVLNLDFFEFTDTGEIITS